MGTNGFTSGQFGVGFHSPDPDPDKPYLAIYWRSQGVHVHACGTINEAIEMMAQREMLGQILSIAILRQDIDEMVFQFVNPAGERFVRTIYDAKAARIWGNDYN